MHFWSGDGLGCPSSERKYRERDLWLTSDRGRRTSSSRSRPHAPDEPPGTSTDSLPRRRAAGILARRQNVDPFPRGNARLPTLPSARSSTWPWKPLSEYSSKTPISPNAGPQGGPLHRSSCLGATPGAGVADLANLRTAHHRGDGTCSSLDTLLLQSRTGAATGRDARLLLVVRSGSQG